MESSETPVLYSSRVLERPSPDSDTDISWTARIESTGVSVVTAVCVNCNIGHFSNGSKFTAKKILVCTRTPDDITTKYVGCIRRVEIKSYVVSACQLAGPRETARLPAGRNFVMFYTEEFYFISVEKI